MPLNSTRGAGSSKGFGLTSGRTILPFISATGGTVLTCGNFKTHVFTSDGEFKVTNEGTPLGSSSFEYFVVAGGASGGSYFRGGGGGAGGFRNNYPSPVNGGLTAVFGSFPIQVGAGGPVNTGLGTPSIFSSIASTRGGWQYCGNIPGGSGGGTDGAGTLTNGNAGGFSPPEGSPGGRSTGGCSPGGGGGGGASATGGNGAPGNQVPAGPGGAGSGIANAFFGPTSPSYGTPGPDGGLRYFAGGGGGGTYGPGSAGTGGVGGGGTVNVNGGVNTGGGGGAGRFTGYPPSTFPSSGGSGLVAIRYRFQ